MDDSDTKLRPKSVVFMVMVRTLIFSYRKVGRKLAIGPNLPENGRSPSF